MVNKNFKIGIIGGGAVGLTYAALLAPVANVIIKTRSEEQANALKTQGLHLIERLKTPVQSQDKKETIITNIDATANSKDLITCDAIIITVKSYDTKKVAEEISSTFKEDTEILTIQNGLEAFPILQKTIKNPARVFAGVTLIGASRLDPRSVSLDFNLTCIIDSNASILAQVLQRTKFDFETSTHIKQAVWNKMAFSTAQNALSAITNLPFGKMNESEECLSIAKKLLEEFHQIAQAEGISFNYSLIDKLRNNWHMSKHYSSMWQDIHKKNKTEIDAMNGAISTLGRKHHIATPYNDMITSLIKILEVN